MNNYKLRHLGGSFGENVKAIVVAQGRCVRVSPSIEAVTCTCTGSVWRKKIGANWHRKRKFGIVGKWWVVNKSGSKVEFSFRPLSFLFSTLFYTYPSIMLLLQQRSRLVSSFYRQGRLFSTSKGRHALISAPRNEWPLTETDPPLLF
jgi:hypothetical protein